MFEYEVVPVVITRGASGAAADEEWEKLRATLNRFGTRGYRVVAVTEGQEGRAIIMERSTDSAGRKGQAQLSVSQAAEKITWESSRGGG